VLVTGGNIDRAKLATLLSPSPSHS